LSSFLDFALRYSEHFCLTKSAFGPEFSNIKIEAKKSKLRDNAPKFVLIDHDGCLENQSSLNQRLILEKYETFRIYDQKI